MAKREASIRVYLTPDAKERLRVVCFRKGVTMSDIAAELIECWLKENDIPERTEEVKPQPESFTELVRQNYFTLMNSGKIAPMRLKDLSFGHKPNPKELKLIASVLNFNPEDLERLVS